MTKALPSTAEELERIGNDYLQAALSGRLTPTKISHEEIGTTFREQLEDERGINKIVGGSLVVNSEDDAELGRHIHRGAAVALFAQQIEEHQLQHQISGLIEETFTFHPLDFTCQALRLGLWLSPLGDDPKRLKANAWEIAAAFLRAAEGPGAEWIRYREIDFKLEDGTPAWRYQRDNWAELQATATAATSANIRGGLAETQGHESLALHLTLWQNEDSPGVENGKCTTWLLVHPALPLPLDAPDTYWC